MSVTPDGRRALSGSRYNTLRVWNLQSGQCLAIYHAGAGVQSVAMAHTDGHIVCGSVDGQMHFLTMRNFPGPSLHPLPAAPQTAKKPWWQFW